MSSKQGPPSASNRSREIWEKDKAHFLHPWTHFDSFKKEGSLVMSQAEGCYVYDIDGRQYFDGIGGLWCVNAGYGREEIVEAIAEQARRLAFFNPFVDTTNEPASLLAAKLASLAPGDLNHVFFSLGGSEANDTAYRLAQFYHYCRGEPERRHFLSRKDAYHGSTYISASLSGKASDRSPGFRYEQDYIHHLSAPNCYRAPKGMSEEQFCDFLVKEFEDKISELGANNIAAFFAEPLQGSGGVVVPPDNYLHRVYEICKKHGILFIADEVVTAFGRIGHMFASEAAFSVKPDIINCAKGLTSGYQPLGATIFSDEIYDVISSPDPDRWFTHGFTYSGHPVACAAALANIEIFENEDICGHVREVGPYFEERLQTLLDLPIVGDVRGSHLMMCIENVADKSTKELFSEEVNIGKRISDHAEHNGLIVRPIGHLNVLSPPLIITRQQIDNVVDALRSSIEATMNDLEAEGVS